MDWVTKHDNHVRNKLSNFLHIIGVISDDMWMESFLETE